MDNVVIPINDEVALDRFLFYKCARRVWRSMWWPNTFLQVWSMREQSDPNEQLMTHGAKEVENDLTNDDDLEREDHVR